MDYYTNKANLCESISDTEHLNQNVANSHCVEVKYFNSGLLLVQRL